MTTEIKSLFVGVTLLGLMFGPPAEAITVIACVKPAGTWRVATAKKPCKKAETAINLNSEGVVGPAGPKGDRGATGEPGYVKVYDNNGQYLGYLADPTIFTVYLPSLQVTAAIDVDPTSATYGKVVPLKEDTPDNPEITPQYFTAANCDRKISKTYYAPRYQQKRLVSKDGRYYIASTKTTISQVTVASMITINPATQQIGCANISPPQAYWVGESPTYELSSEVPKPFDTPVAFPLRFE
jgi:hypothetical protein